MQKHSNDDEKMELQKLAYCLEFLRYNEFSSAPNP